MTFKNTPTPPKAPRKPRSEDINEPGRAIPRKTTTPKLSPSDPRDVNTSKGKVRVKAAPVKRKLDSAPESANVAVVVVSVVVRALWRGVRWLGWQVFRVTFLIGRLLWRLPVRARIVTFVALFALFVVGCVLFGRWVTGVLYPPVPPVPPIATLFTREVQYWGPSLRRWGIQYDVDPNLAASVMQIESCGLPGAASNVGAQGLFQVMPFHFTETEKASMTDPETNALRGFGVLKECLGYSDGDAEGALACYNGGPTQINRAPEARYAETRRYVEWGAKIYADAKAGSATSAALTDWLTSGGVYLCERAAVALNLPILTPTPVSGR